ncbi:hypothetical protein ACFFW8_09225 [Erwinia tracheiphila]
MNVFGVRIGRKSSSQQEEQTPSSSPLASPQSSPLPAGRAGRLQRQNATLSNNTRYNARSTPGTPDRARATSRHSGEGSSSSAYSTGPASSSRAVLVRQGGNREHSQLAQFHEMMQVSPKISRNDPLPETPESIPRRLQEKMDTVNLPELESWTGDSMNTPKWLSNGSMRKKVPINSCRNWIKKCCRCSPKPKTRVILT